MLTVKINGKDYNLKFGLRVVTKSKLISKIVDSQLQDNTMGVGLEKLAETIAEIFLAGSQSEVPELQYDLDNEIEKEKKLDVVYGLLDDYSEDGNDLFDLYKSMDEELEKKGFMADAAKMLKVAAEKLKVEAKNQKVKSLRPKTNEAQKSE